MSESDRGLSRAQVLKQIDASLALDLSRIDDVLADSVVYSGAAS
jgi:hypothetical protein